MSMSMMRTLIAILGLIGFVLVGDEARADFNIPAQLHELPANSCGTPFWFAVTDLRDKFTLYHWPWRCLGDHPDEPIVVDEGIGDVEGKSILIGLAPQTFRGGTVTFPADGMLDRHWRADDQAKLRRRGLYQWLCGIDHPDAYYRCGVKVHFPGQAVEFDSESITFTRYNDDVAYGTTEVAIVFDWEEWGVTDPSLNNRLRV